MFVIVCVCVCSSRKWELLDAQEKNVLQMANKDDGEFWSVQCVCVCVGGGGGGLTVIVCIQVHDTSCSSVL